MRHNSAKRHIFRGCAHRWGLWPPNSNSAEIFVQCTYPQVSSSCVYSSGSYHVDTQTHRRRWKHLMFFAMVNMQTLNCMSDSLTDVGITALMWLTLQPLTVVKVCYRILSNHNNVTSFSFWLCWKSALLHRKLIRRCPRRNVFIYGSESLRYKTKGLVITASSRKMLPYDTRHSLVCIYFQYGCS